VLWVVLLLSLLVSAFAFDMHIEARIVSYCRKRLQAEYLAQAGLERARSLLIHGTQVKDERETDENRDKPWYEDARRLKRGQGVTVTDTLGGGALTLDIAPEPARRNVNALRDEDWERLLEIGGVPQELWSGLIDSYNDWRDGDDQPGVDGAETDDYYSRLDPPYQARGHGGQAANLDTVEELGLIKGFTREILYGGELPDGKGGKVGVGGIADMLTATPNPGVNVNAASRRVLMTLPGIDGTLADAIIAEREGLTEGAKVGQDYAFKDSGDFFNRMPELSELSPEERSYLEALIRNMGSQVFRIISRGIVQGVQRQVSCVVQFSGNRLMVLRWTEQEG
jgi:hypothetical protein